MKYSPFNKLRWMAGIGVVVGLGWIGFRGCAEPDGASAPATSRSTAAGRPTTEQVRGMLEAWLTAHGDRGGKMRMNDILPAAPFKATAIRFPDVDAAKFSNDPRQWSQIRLDLDRDGVDDEKWLLKNGHTYKREVLDAAGRTTVTQYFDK
jgi:hypothetical protein